MTETTDPALRSCCAMYYKSGNMDVVVTGCDGDRSVTIGGKGSWMYDASTDDFTQVQLADGSCNAEKPPEDMGPDMKPLEVDESVPDIARNTQNAEFLTEVQYYYDQSLLAKFNGNHEEAKNAVREMHEHTSVHMRHSSIGRRVHLELLEEIEFVDIHTHAGAPNSLGIFGDWLRARNKCDRTVAFHHLITDREVGDFTSGVAYVGTICARNCFNSGITELWSSIASAALTLSHEFGHNLGMLHTFDPVYEGRNCHGIMSYGPRPDSWSECSQEAWQNDYDTFLSNQGQARADRCFKPLPDTLVPPTPNPTASPTFPPVSTPPTVPITTPTVSPTPTPTASPTAEPTSQPTSQPVTA